MDRVARRAVVSVLMTRCVIKQLDTAPPAILVFNRLCVKTVIDSLDWHRLFYLFEHKVNETE